MAAAQPLRTVRELVAAGLIAPADRDTAAAAAERQPVMLPPALLALIDPADPDDPIARQFVPSPAELDIRPEEFADPIGDAAHSPVKGIVHRYPDRVLLIPTLTCAVQCRFCFRRDRVGRTRPLTVEDLRSAMAYIHEHRTIREVILTGGDPLTLPTRQLLSLIGMLDNEPHVEAIRLHTRLPVADPGRVTAELAAGMGTEHKAVWVSVHVNHPRELTPAAVAALRRLAEAGIALISQTVLLRGVNDRAETLEALFRALVRAGVKPYYLHHGDLAPGTAHFRTGIAEGQALIRTLWARLSGLCRPAYVLDLPGGHGKVPLTPCAATGSDQDGWQVEDAAGRHHDYPPAADRGLAEPFQPNST